MGKRIIVSVVMPLYNCERYVAEAIDSVREQTFTNWELIVVDDGSTDNSACILQDYSSKDSRIQIITQKNAGLSAARNACF